MNNLHGIPIIINNLLGEKVSRSQVRFPRSKKKRIRKKWAKDPRNYTFKVCREPEGYLMGSMLIMNDEMKVKLKTALFAAKITDRLGSCTVSNSFSSFLQRTNDAAASKAPGS